MAKHFFKNSKYSEEEDLFPDSILDAFRGPSTKTEANRHMDAIWDRIERQTQGSIPSDRQSKRRSYGITELLKIAAILVIGSTIGLVSYLQSSRLENATNSDSYVEVFNPPGSITTFYLPDSSRVVMNHNSKIRKSVIHRNSAMVSVQSNSPEKLIWMYERMKSILSLSKLREWKFGCWEPVLICGPIRIQTRPS